MRSRRQQLSEPVNYAHHLKTDPFQTTQKYFSGQVLTCTFTTLWNDNVTIQDTLLAGQVQSQKLHSRHTCWAEVLQKWFNTEKPHGERKKTSNHAGLDGRWRLTITSVWLTKTQNLICFYLINIEYQKLHPVTSQTLPPAEPCRDVLHRNGHFLHSAPSDCSGHIPSAEGIKGKSRAAQPWSWMLTNTTVLLNWWLSSVSQT